VRALQRGVERDHGSRQISQIKGVIPNHALFVRRDFYDELAGPRTTLETSALRNASKNRFLARYSPLRNDKGSARVRWVYTDDNFIFTRLERYRRRLRADGCQRRPDDGQCAGGVVHGERRYGVRACIRHVNKLLTGRDRHPRGVQAGRHNR
jgi:hypothetical protein